MAKKIPLDKLPPQYEELCRLLHQHGRIQETLYLWNYLYRDPAPTERARHECWIYGLDFRIMELLGEASSG